MDLKGIQIVIHPCHTLELIIEIRLYRSQANLSLKIKNMEGSLLAPSLYTVKGILILDNSGERVFSKYYDPNIFPSLKEQHTFEKSLFSKTEKANSEILMLDGLTIL